MPYRVLATKRLRYGGEYTETEVIREYSPCRRTIKIANKFINLPFPYVLFYWTNPELYVGFAKKPITSVRSLLYAAPLGNVYEYGRVCGCAAYRTRKDQSVIARAIDLFWNKSFTLSDGTIGPDSLDATFNDERIKREKHRQIINDNDYDGYEDHFYGYNSYISDNLLFSWSKLKPEQLIRRLYYCPRTFKDFLASPLSGGYDEYEYDEYEYDVLPRDIVSELKITLTLNSEYQKLYVPGISKKRRRNRTG